MVAAKAGSAAEWAAKAQRAEALGYASFLVPDRFDFVISPVPALAYAAAVTRTIHLGTFVLACGLRNSAVLAQECRALDLLSGGRFEVGLGAGASEGEFQRAGLDFGSPAQRVARVLETFTALQADNPDRPVLVAGSGRRLLSWAASHADIVGLAAAPTAGLTEVQEKAAWIRAAAGDRLPDLGINLNLLAVGDNPGSRLPARLGLDLEDLKRRQSPYILTGTPEAMREQLLARREALGVSYITVNDGVIEELAPVIELLAGG